MSLDTGGPSRLRLGIHATNISGIGATNLVQSLLPALLRVLSARAEMTLFTGGTGPIVEWVSCARSRLTVVKRRRLLPNAVSRFFECIWPSRGLRQLNSLIVLGDLPLRVSVDQIVYVHQPHLVSPRVDAYSSSALKYRIARALFWYNAGCARVVVVQTETMRTKLAASYRGIADRIVVVPAPCPAWFRPAMGERRLRRGAKRLRLFYPAALYPHKNHSLLSQIPSQETLQWPVEELTLTVRPSDNPNPAIPWVKCVGPLEPAQCMQEYDEADGLVFLSTAESYGLPLVEAMSAGLPVICPDLEYAHTLCGDTAIYFDPRRVATLQAAVKELHRRLLAGWQPDWRPMLERLPRDWDEVAARFAALIDSGALARRQP